MRVERSQRGATLLEALIGFLIVSVGWLAVAQMQSRLRHGADHARQQAEAGRLAQQQFERLRARAAAAPPSGALDPGVESRTSVLEVDATDTRYRIELARRPADGAALEDVQIDVRWADASGLEQRLGMSGMLHAQSAALALPLAAGRRDRTGRVNGRHAAIPREAVDRGDGRSIFKPAADSSQAWLFDNRTAPHRGTLHRPGGCHARRAARCRHLRMPTRGQAAARRHLRVAPEAGSEPLRADVALRRPDGGAADADCISEVVRGVDAGTVGMPRVIAVGTAARPTDHGVAQWRELGDRFVRYHCAVAAQPTGGGRPQWGGRLAIVRRAGRSGSTRAPLGSAAIPATPTAVAPSIARQKRPTSIARSMRHSCTRTTS